LVPYALTGRVGVIVDDASACRWVHTGKVRRHLHLTLFLDYSTARNVISIGVYPSRIHVFAHFPPFSSRYLDAGPAQLAPLCITAADFMLALNENQPTAAKRLCPRARHHMVDGSTGETQSKVLNDALAIVMRARRLASATRS
jgi:hypothetical protein